MQMTAVGQGQLRLKMITFVSRWVSRRAKPSTATRAGPNTDELANVIN
jgi:hypothetical protein